MILEKHIQTLTRDATAKEEHHIAPRGIKDVTYYAYVPHLRQSKVPSTLQVIAESRTRFKFEIEFEGYDRDQES